MKFSILLFLCLTLVGGLQAASIRSKKQSQQLSKVKAPSARSQKKVTLSKVSTRVGGCLQEFIDCAGDGSFAQCTACIRSCAAQGLAAMRGGHAGRSRAATVINLCPVLAYGSASGVCSAIIWYYRPSGRRLSSTGTCSSSSYFKWQYSFSHGGTGGGSFNSLPELRFNDKVQAIFMRTGNRLDGIGFRTDRQSTWYGGYGGSYKSLTLSSNARITKFEVCIGHYRSTRVFYVKFDTTSGSISGGKRTSDCRSYHVPADMYVNGLYGRAGNEVDALGMVMQQSMPYYYYKTTARGGGGGSGFDNEPSLKYDDVIESITIRTGRRVDRVEFKTTHSIFSNGGSGGSGQILSLRNTDRITSFEVCIGHYRSTRVFYVKFVTTAGTISGGTKTSQCYTSTISSGDYVAGMHGRRGNEVDAVGLVVRRYRTVLY